MKSSYDASFNAYPKFVEAVRKRLEKGTEEYGDSSFTRRPSELVSEIEEEILDISAWSYILWIRMRGLSERISECESLEAGPF